MGRKGFFDEVMRFYDRWLKGDDAGRQGSEARPPDERRHVARRDAVAAGRLAGD